MSDKTANSVHVNIGDGVFYLSTYAGADPLGSFRGRFEAVEFFSASTSTAAIDRFHIEGEFFYFFHGSDMVCVMAISDVVVRFAQTWAYRSLTKNLRRDLGWRPPKP
jgi:hypothetical protein